MKITGIVLLSSLLLSCGINDVEMVVFSLKSTNAMAQVINKVEKLSYSIWLERGETNDVIYFSRSEWEQEKKYRYLSIGILKDKGQILVSDSNLHDDDSAFIMLECKISELLYSTVGRNNWIKSRRGYSTTFHLN